MSFNGENDYSNTVNESNLKESQSSQDKENQDDSCTTQIDTPENPETNDISEEMNMLNHLLLSPAIFVSQQIGEPDLTDTEKKKIAGEILHKSPANFLIRFGPFLKEEHLNYLGNKYNSSEVTFYVNNFRTLLCDRSRKIIKKNRRYEAMKRMEAEGSYFSEIEMEKREPLLYHQMVGQYLSEKEKIQKNVQAHNKQIPTFLNFLISQMEKDELDELKNFQQKEEDKLGKEELSSDEEPLEEQVQSLKRWGEDWEEVKQSKKKVKVSKKEKNNITSEEKYLLLQEFKSIMQTKFLNGKDVDFNYSEVDYNPNYDSIELRTQDEEEKYFEEETSEISVCTDTGIEDY